MGCGTSQCSTSLPLSKRKIPITASPRVPGSLTNGRANVITVGEYAHDAAMLESSGELAESFYTTRDIGIVLRVGRTHQVVATR